MLTYFLFPVSTALSCIISNPEEDGSENVIQWEEYDVKIKIKWKKTRENGKVIAVRDT